MSAKRRNYRRQYERIDVALDVRLFLPDDNPEELRFEAFSESQNLCPGGVYVSSTFLLKRENRRLYVVAFLDDHSRFIVSFGVHASSTGALVREAFLAVLKSDM